jgi:Protein of unknown function (DUF1614)
VHLPGEQQVLSQQVIDALCRASRGPLARNVDCGKCRRGSASNADVDLPPRQESIVDTSGLGHSCDCSRMLLAVPTDSWPRNCREPVFVPAVTAAIVALLLSREHTAQLAYIGGSLGTLIGADLLNLGNIRGLAAPVASTVRSWNFRRHIPDRDCRCADREPPAVMEPGR